MSIDVKDTHFHYRIHGGVEGGQADGSTQRCKNPLVPRQLVGQSHNLPRLSPVYTDSSSLVSGTGLDSKHRKMSTGTQTRL